MTQPPHPGKSRTLTYLAAAALGVCAVAILFPSWALRGAWPAGAPNADFAAHVLGERYFLADAWRWPPLAADNLDVPFGTNIGLTDSLPLLALAVKPFRAVLPVHFQYITVWLAFAWLMQPIAAVFALRGFGQKRSLPCLVAAVCALATPTFLSRQNHAALAGHFTLLLALGLAQRIVASREDRRIWMRAACLLVPCLLLIQPYLMLMAAAILTAAPITLCVRRDPRWGRVALATAATLAVTCLLALILGYAGGAETSGFGVYSMNLLSPLWPSTSRVFAPFGIHPLDMTGGQYEGFQYLGAGILACLLAGVALRPGACAAALRANAGLVLVCLGLTALAVSNRVYAGHLLLLDLPQPRPAGIFRASGRLFWPVLYAIEIGGIALLSGWRHRLAPAMLVAVAALQAFDASPGFAQEHAALRQTLPFAFDAHRLGRMMAASRLATVIPPWPCEATAQQAQYLMQVLWIAGESLVPTTTMYAARATHPPRCDMAQAAGRPLIAGELRVFLPGHARLAAQTPDATAVCASLEPLTVCSADPAILKLADGD